MKTGIVRWVVPYAGPILLCLALGALASWLQQGALETWYPYLRKSPLTPPGYVFPVAWTLLYVLIGLAFGAVWHAGAKGPGTRGRRLLVLWSVQCLLNFGFILTPHPTNPIRIGRASQSHQVLTSQIWNAYPFFTIY